MAKAPKRMRVENMKLGFVNKGVRRVPKTHAEALLMGFREANEGLTEDCYFSYDLKRIEGSFGFYQGLSERNRDYKNDEMLIIPFTAKVTLGRPYYPKKEPKTACGKEDAIVLVARAGEEGAA
jgi:hypothetical protein